MSDYNDSYISAALNPHTAPKLIRMLVKNIRNRGIKFDTIVCRGTSGLLVAPTVAQRLRKHLIVSRKSDGNHSGAKLEGFNKPRRFIIVDDFVCTGSTVKVMLDTMAEVYPMSQCVAFFGWRSSGESPIVWKDKNSKEHHIAKFSMWPNDNCESFTFEPEMKVRKPKPAPAPVPLIPPTEAEMYFHKAAARAVQGELITTV